MYTARQLADLSSYSIHTIRKKKDLMKEGVHFIKLKTGRILYTDMAVDFLLDQEEVNENENIQRKNLQTKKEQVSLYGFISKRTKTAKVA